MGVDYKVGCVHGRRRRKTDDDWLLHDIAIANILLCMAYKRGVGGRVVYCVIVEQWYCIRVGFAGDEWGHSTDD